MKKKLFLLILLIIVLIPVYAKEDKYKIISGDIETVGSEICFDTECFYVMGNDGNSVKMLAKYNLYVGGKYEDRKWTAYGDSATGLQDSLMIGYPAVGGFPRHGVTAFSSNEKKGTYYSDYNGSIVEEYVDNYKEYLNEIDVVLSCARLAKKEELIALGCDAVNNYSCEAAPEFIYSTSYWVESLTKDEWVTLVESTKNFGCTKYDNVERYGVRPVIEVPVGWFDEDGTVYNGAVEKINVSEGVISNDDSSVDLVFNDLGQDAKYEAILYNNTDKNLYVNSLDVEGLSDEFIQFRLDDKSENMIIESNGSTKVSFYVNTLVKNGAGKNLEDDVTINFRVSDKTTNPNTFSDTIEFILLVVILSLILFIIYKYSSKKVRFSLFVISIIIGSTIVGYAKDSNVISIKGKIKYESLNIIETTGTVIKDGVVDYSNSKDIWTYYDDVKNINISSFINEPEGYVEKFDLSLNNDNKVIGYLVENDDEDVPYDLYIMSHGAVIANDDSSFLFSFSNVESINGLSNIDFSGCTSMKGLFAGDKVIEELSIDEVDISGVSDASYMFYKCDELDIKKEQLEFEKDTDTSYMFTTYLFDVIGEGAVSDIDVNFKSAPSSTQLKYVINKTLNDDYPIYYYRGGVIDNNIKFGNFCWKIVRTTDTGGTKLIYNGVPAENGGCNNTGNNSQIGVSKYGNKPESITDAVYMYGLTHSHSMRNVGSQTIDYYYGSDIKYDENTKKYTLIDPIKSNDFSVDYKSVADGHRFTCFSDSSECDKVYFIYFIRNENTIVDILTLTGGKYLDDYFGSIFGNENNSLIKTVVDTWYKDNLLDYSEYIEDTVWCNDRSIYEGSLIATTNISIVSGNKFGAYGRNSVNFKPVIECSDRDSFTVSNGSFEYPVGLLTADELTLAGNGVYGKNSYLNNGSNWWTMSLATMSNTTTVYYASSSKMSSKWVWGEYGVRPSISLKEGTLVVAGDGTVDKPYIIE